MPDSSDSSFPDLSARWSAAGPRVINRLAPGQDSPPYTLFDVKPLGPLIGAEISGLDLRAPMTTELRAEVDRALLEWKVIFFRNQHLTADQHRMFARAWGELETNPFLPHGADADITRFAMGADKIGRQNVWHTDVTWRKNPAMGSVLRMIEVPSDGTGDTMWADAGAAYDNLPEDVKTFIGPLVAVHDFIPTFGLFLPADQLRSYRQRFPLVAHPVVRTHPVTSRKTLFVNVTYTTHIPVLPLRRSEELLRFLFAQARIPELQVRWRWSAGDVAFWDNRATWHYAVSDYFPRRRVAERVSIVGDEPY